MMLSGSPIIIENFYQNDFIKSTENHHHKSQFHTNYVRHHRHKEQKQDFNTPKKTSLLLEQTSSSKASTFKTTAMSAFNLNQKDAEYPIINVEAENEHFEISDSLISWMERYKASSSLMSSIDDEETGIDSRSRYHLSDILPSPSSHHQLSAPGMAWNLVKIFSKKQGSIDDLLPPEPFEEPSNFYQVQLVKKSPSPHTNLSNSVSMVSDMSFDHSMQIQEQDSNSSVRMRGNDEWAPPRAQIIFNVHEENNFRKLMQRQNYRCAGCGTKIDLELARRLVLYCYYLGKYFCKCCFSHKAIHLPGHILQKWDFHKYPVSHFALQLLDRIANEPLFNINDINSSLYRKVKKMRHLVDIRMQLYFLKIYITTCTQTDKLNHEFTSFTHQHLLQDDVHLYSLNNLIEIQHGKLYEYLNDLVTRSISHIAQCDRCRAKGHYCQLCGPSSLMSSLILSTGSNNDQSSKNNQPKLRHSNSIGQNISTVGVNQGVKVTGDGLLRQQGNHSRSSSGNYSNFTLSSNLSGSGMTPSNHTNTQISVNVDDHELIFPFEIGRVAQCRACGCCFHLKCFIDADQNCPKCERVQRRKAEITTVTNDPTLPTTIATS